MKYVVFLFLSVFLVNSYASFINVYPKLKSYHTSPKEDVGEPLLLTPLIESGKINEAREKSAVEHAEIEGINSYSGYFTVNKDYGSNMFFWFFPAQVRNFNKSILS